MSQPQQRRLATRRQAVTGGNLLKTNRSPGVRAQMKRREEIGRELEVTPDQQISLTDPDARSMATSGRGTGTVGYNGQARRRHPT